MHTFTHSHYITLLEYYQTPHQDVLQLQTVHTWSCIVSSLKEIIILGCHQDLLNKKLSAVVCSLPFGYCTGTGDILIPKLFHFADLRNLHSINLSFTLVTDTGMKKISMLNSLKSVNLDNRLITDVGLAALIGIYHMMQLAHILC